MDKEVKRDLINFIIVGFILSFGFNFVSTKYMTEELVLNGGGFAYLLVSLTIVNPLFFVFYGSILAKNIKQTWWSILLVASFFHFSMIMFYGTNDGIFYVRNYIIVGYIPMIVSYFINKNQANKQFKIK